MKDKAGQALHKLLSRRQYEGGGEEHEYMDLMRKWEESGGRSPEGDGGEDYRKRLLMPEENTSARSFSHLI